MKDHLQTFSDSDVEVKKRDVVYQGAFRMVKLELRHRRYNGDWSAVFSREVMERKPAAAILPYDPILDTVVLIEQFRPGALTKREVGPWLIEIVAGINDKAEEPAEVAVREAKEEAGCEILEIYPIYEYFVSPGGTNEYIHVFCGRVDASDLGGIHGLEEEHEDIRTLVMPREEAFALLQEGKIKAPPAIISLQWLQLNHNWLRQLWQTK